MTSTKEHARKVLSGILPERRDLLERAITQLNEEHFSEDTKIYGNLFLMLRICYEKTHAVASRQMISDILSHAPNLERKRAIAYEEEFDLLCSLETGEADFLWSVDQLQESVAEKATLEAFTEGMLIANHGKLDEQGNEIR